MESWAKSRHKDFSEIENEFLAIERAIKYASYLKLLVIGLFIENKMIGFLLMIF